MGDLLSLQVSYSLSFYSTLISSKVQHAPYKSFGSAHNITPEMPDFTFDACHFGVSCDAYLAHWQPL